MSIINKITGKDEKTPKSKTSGSVKSAKVVEKKDVVVSKKSKSETTPVKKTNERVDVNAYKILQRPVITEKSAYINQFNKYVFAVPVSATKSEVKKKIMNVYGVKPLSINMLVVGGKKVRRGRTVGWTKDWKKAIVTLAPQDKIEIYEGV